MKKNLSAGIIYAALAAFCVILVSINIFQENLKKKMTAEIYVRLSELSVNNATRITSKISDQFEMMGALSTYIANEDLRGEEVLSILNQTVKNYGFLRCAITFPDGSFITHDSRNEGNTATEEHVTKGFEGISSVTGPRAAVADPSKTVILLTVPIRRDGIVNALLTCTYETQYLNRIVTMTYFEGKGYSYITGIDGSMISKPGIGRTIYDGDNILAFFREEFSGDDYLSIASDLENMRAGATEIRRDDDNKFISYQPLGINDWYIFSITSSEVLNRQLDSVLIDVYTLSVAILVIFLSLTVLIAYYIYWLDHKAKAELEQLAYYDSLTKIPNKAFFEIRAGRILSYASAQYAYILLNVNKFKLVNDMFGFAQGDSLLRHIAETLRSESGKDEAYARFDADNFHILYVYNGTHGLEERLMLLASRIGGYVFDKKVPHALSVGFGVYRIEDKDKPISYMGDKARVALSKIKGTHFSAISFYDEAMTQQLKEEQEIENTMQGALDNGEMVLYLQGKYSTCGGVLIGAEALVRWYSPQKGMVMPDSFIPLFEKNGFIIELDMYMVETACRTLRGWQDGGIVVVPVSVNQSRQCLYHPHYIDELTDILNQYAISPALIELEITERAFFEDEATLIRIIQQLHDQGFMVAMDDFGAGYSSLNMLQDVNVDILKIDKNFFKESVNSVRGKKIVSNIVSLANDLNIEVVAEGIETKEQLEFLRDIHCDFVQGFYFSRPVSAKEFKSSLAKDKKG